MNRNLPVLVWLTSFVFALSVLLNGFFVFQNLMLYKDLERANAQIAEGTQIQAILPTLINDLLVYGQKQPEIYSILKKYGISTPAPAPAPTTTPPKSTSSSKK